MVINPCCMTLLEEKNQQTFGLTDPSYSPGCHCSCCLFKDFVFFEVQNQTGRNNISPLWKHLTSQQNKELSPSQDTNKTIFLFCPSSPSPAAFNFLQFVYKGESLHLNAVYLQTIYHLCMVMTAAINAVDLSVFHQEVPKGHHSQSRFSSMQPILLQSRFHPLWVNLRKRNRAPANIVRKRFRVYSINPCKSLLVSSLPCKQSVWKNEKRLS